MTYRRFEELPVWNDAIELAVRVFHVSATDEIRSISGLRDQLERAVLSISNNIAEGFERGTNEELKAFLYIARGSSGEVRSMVHLMMRLCERTSLQEDLRDLLGRSENIGRQLGRWIDAIRSSGQQGERALSATARQARESAQRREAFQAELRRIQDEAARNGLAARTQRAGHDHPRPPDDSDG